MADEAMLSESAFRDELNEAISLNRAMFEGGETISVDLAWSAYRADPARFHAASGDNPEGNVGAAFVLEEGPWWVNTVKVAAAQLASAQEAFEAAITQAVEDGHSLRDVASWAGISHEQVRRIAN